MARTYPAPVVRVLSIHGWSAYVAAADLRDGAQPLLTLMQRNGHPRPYRPNDQSARHILRANIVPPGPGKAHVRLAQHYRRTARAKLAAARAHQRGEPLPAPYCCWPWARGCDTRAWVILIREDLRMARWHARRAMA